MALVEQVKAIQKQPGGQDLWVNFINQAGAGTMRDPALRPPEFLIGFLNMAAVQGFNGNGGGARTSAVPKIGPNKVVPKLMGNANIMSPRSVAPAVAPSMQMSLVTRVKAAQKMEGGREAWIDFVSRKGSDKLDPALQSATNLKEFLAQYDPVGLTLAPALDMATQQMAQLPLMGMGPMGALGMLLKQMGGLHQPSVQQRSKEKSGHFAAQSEEHAHLIARVKAVQKTPDGKEKWADFCCTTNIGKRDPAAHSLDSLYQFLQEADPDSETISARGAYDEGQALAAQIRRGQRVSDEFRQAWIQYTEENGGGVRDPAKHEIHFIRSFLEIAPAYNLYEHDEQHAQLVQRIKQGQRSSADFKAAWWKFCADHGDAKNDPSKHDANFLVKFLNTQGDSKGRGKAPTKSSMKPGRARPY